MDIQIHEIEKDMADQQYRRIEAAPKTRIPWQPLFESESYWNQLEERQLGQNVLTKRQLKHYGKVVTRLRDKFL